MYLYRLCKSIASAPGGPLTGSWRAEKRRALGARLVALPDDIEVLPIRALAFRMAEIGDAYRVSTLGAEAVAAAENLMAPLCVWDGDDGPGLRAAVAALHGDYRTIRR